MSTEMSANNIAIIVTATENTWDVIGQDHMDACETCGETVTNRLAISACFDHMNTYGGNPTAYPLLQELIKSHSYNAVLTKLSETCNLL